MLSKKRKISNDNDSSSDNIQQRLKRFARNKKDNKNDNNDVSNNGTVINENSTNDEITLIESSIPLAASPITEKMLSIEQNLCTKLLKINYQCGVEYIYNPIDYAFEVHAMYIRRYCNNVKKILFLGINPGPWGMSQTGVPFGEISMVRDWLKLSGNVGKPLREQPGRKITGFDCPRSEVSGRRFWGLFREICKDPKNFFEHAYLHNYCPIALMDSKGRNITPADLKGEGQKLLHEVCDQALIDIVRLLQIKIIVGIGKYAEKRAQTIVSEASLSVQVVSITHPSPRVKGNEDWNKKIEDKLHELDLMQYFNNELVHIRQKKNN